MKFRTTVLNPRGTATGIAVPDDVLAALDAGRRPALQVAINDYVYRTTVGSVNGTAMISISAAVRTAAGVAAGDVIEVDVVLDTEPRQVTVPGDLAAALAGDATAAAFFDQLSVSHQSAYVLWIEAAKKDETRQRRVGEAVEMLRAGRRQR
ncbi:MAG: YdeI/OmpD-associated family protein [Cellulomonas sp.]